MIVVITTASHGYTHAGVADFVPALRRASYPAILRRRRLPRATYVFTDFDRLGFWQLELAAHLFRALRDAGCRVLNDPAAVMHRLPLLRRLHAEGINSFAAWPAEEIAAVDRFPVFLRTRSAHRGVLTGLIADAGALAAACRHLVGDGYPLGDLMAVEYRAEPIHGDVFEKLSVYRVGDVMTPCAGVHERHWVAKYGQDCGGEAAYAEELAAIRDNRFAGPARRVFEIAGADYGRVDFGIVGGRPEFYEINTNPAIAIGPARVRTTARGESIQLARDALLDALAGLDTAPGGGDVAIRPHPLLARAGRRRRLWPGYSWLP